MTTIDTIIITACLVGSLIASLFLAYFLGEQHVLSVVDFVRFALDI